MVDKVPTPPTDNLYKAATLVGLIGAALTLLGPLYLEQRRFDQMYQLKQAKLENDEAMLMATNTAYGVSVIFLFAALSGTVLGIGFRYWYRWHQKYQDELIKLQVETKKQELERVTLEVERLQLEVAALKAKRANPSG